MRLKELHNGKPESSLRETCTDQLDAFLQDKTKEFVSELFENLKTKAYLPNDEETGQTCVFDAQGRKEITSHVSERCPWKQEIKMRNKD